MTLVIRTMTPADVDIALGWARNEGWNPGLDDAAPFFAQDPGGFLMGWLGTLRIGCISVVRYGQDFAFLGLFIVLPAFRGKGHGKALWDAGIASAAGRVIGLDGVPQQQQNYARSGFVLAHRSARWGGRPSGLVAKRSYVRPVTPADMPAIVAFDRQHVPGERRAFLSNWLSPSSSRQTEGYFDDGALRGYGTIRRAADGWKIGPLFAQSPAVAEALLVTLLAPAGTDPVFIDIPEPNGAAAEIAKRLGLNPSFETARMYLGPAPSLPLDEIYGITTLELG